MKQNNKLGRRVLMVLTVIAIAAAVNFLPMITPMVPGMESYSYSGITVHAMEKDADEAEVIAARVAEASEGLRKALKMETEHNEPIEIIVYPNRKALHRKTIGLAGYFLPAWFIGDNTRKYVLITSPAEPGPAHSRESIIQASVHEYVHLLTDRRNKKMGYWLKEGFALYLAEQKPSRASVAAVRDITWEEYANPSAIQFAEVGGYSLAYNLLEYLITGYGWEKVVELIEPGASYKSVFGVEERELFEEWKEQLPVA